MTCFERTAVVAAKEQTICESRPRHKVTAVIQATWVVTQEW